MKSVVTTAADTSAGAAATAIRETTDRFTTQNYARYPIAFTHGKGCRLWDADGREYLDMFAGLAVSSLGHAHPDSRAAADCPVKTCDRP